MGEQPKPWMNEPWPSGPLPQGNDCLRIQPDTCVEPARLRTTPNGVEVKPEPASGGQGGFLDLRYPSHSMPPFREPADLATEVLDAMTRKLRDYDRLSKALTAAQEAATRNLERARKAEERSNVLDGQARQLCVNIDQLRKAIADARAEVERLRGQRDKLEKQRDETGRKLHEATVERDRLFERACKADAARATEEAARDVERNDLRSALTENDALRKALDDSRAFAERLGEAFDCHPGELPRVGRSLSAAMARIAKCVDMVREDEDEVADAVERLREERDRLRARLDDCDSKLTAMRVALSKAGIPESEGYPEVPADPYERSLRAGGRMLGAVERIERLCRERDEYKQAARVEASLGDEARAEAKALRDECEAMRAAKPQPKLTPLLERFSEPIESGKRRSEFDVGIEIEYEGMWDGDVGGWKLRTYGGTVYSAMYSHPVSRLAALIDVNTVLARYGYVLEAWP